jgi:hypothetical protein
MEPPKPPSWDDFHPIGGEPVARHSKLTDYVWITLGSGVAGWLIGGAIYIGFEFWRHWAGVHSDHDPLWRAANKALVTNPVGNDVLLHRIWISAWVGAAAGLVLSLIYMARCYIEEAAAARKMEISEHTRHARKPLE